ncbi:MAG TPA: patatin-like phospholipase family protein [Oscillospiraceae bacterium]|nr:patatin-like phospholipase family protein [Oscillospiraceae bacterium]HRW56853.1 patatin-like phospholipase family protein [Oscillospiraceae bacterium]
MKRGIVLAGGGSRGAYEIGFWQAIRELGITYQIVTGSSVGALNGAMLAAGNFDRAKEMWLGLHTEDVILRSGRRPALIPDMKLLPESMKAVFLDFLGEAITIKMDPSPLKSLMGVWFDEAQMRQSGVNYGMMTTEYPSMKPAPFLLSDIPEGMLPEYMMATSAVFPSMQPREINGKRYIDGGYSDNMPVNLALDMGADEIIAVDLKAAGLERGYETDLPVRVIRPQWPLGKSMEWDVALSAKNLIMGYNDTMKSFGYMDGFRYSFTPGTAASLMHACMESLPALLVGTGIYADAAAKDFTRTKLARTVAENRHLRPGRMPDLFGIVCAEIAGECFELDPTPVYSAPDFTAEIAKAFLPYWKQGTSRVELALGAERDLRHRSALLRKLERRDIISFIYAQIAPAMTGAKLPHEYRLLAGFVPQELWAALWLYSVTNLTPGK